MLPSKFRICRFSIVLSIFLLLYILVDLFVGGYYANTSLTAYDNKFFIIKILGLGLLFVIVTFVYTYLKTSRKSYIDKQASIKAKEIIENSKDSIIRDSKLDPLTQCLNEEFFTQRFKEEYKRAIREKQSISLLIVNIDEFKAYNDIYGRSEGDECIKLIANILVAQCNRPCDLVSKHSNDEFFILLPNTSEAKTVANKCIKSVSSLRIPHENSIASNVLTITIGVNTVIPQNLVSLDDFIKETKASLAYAKKSGRNRAF